MSNQKFQLKPLPYAYSALEPYIDTMTMEIHHGRHVKTYVDNLNGLLESHPEFQSWSLEQIVTNLDKLPESIRTGVRNNAGGVLNHDLFFAHLTPNAGKTPVGKLAEAITETFGSFDEFKVQFKKAALGRFGSGWAWLALTNDKKLVITSTPNQDNVLAEGLQPIILIDVWEHAYYLKYQNKRADYVDQYFNVIDWEKANQVYSDLV